MSTRKAKVPTPCSRASGRRRSTHSGVRGSQVGGHDEQAPHLAGVAAGLLGRGVDRCAPGTEVGQVEAWQRSDPSVGHPARKLQRPRLVAADPDRHVVGGCRSPAGAGEPDVTADVVQGSAVVGPGLTDDLDRLLEGVEGGTGRELLGAEAREGRETRAVGAGPDAQAEPAAAQQVEAGRGSSEHRGRAEGQREDRRAEVDAPCPSGHPAEHGPGIEQGGIVGVVLDERQVEAQLLGEDGEIDGLLRRRGLGGDEHAELERVSVVHLSVPWAGDGPALTSDELAQRRGDLLAEGRQGGPGRRSRG